MSHYVLVCGGRDFDDYERVREPIRLLAVLHGDDLRVMHGGATGADSLAGRVADRMNIRCRVFPADWSTHGKAAGPIRNEQMAEYLAMCESKGHSVQVLAFPGGRGTADMIARAEARGFDVNRL